MPTIEHEDAPLGHVHPIVNWIFATPEELEAYNGVTFKDLHKVAYITSLQQYFAPTQIDGGSGEVTWVQLGIAGGTVSTDLSTTYTANDFTIVSSTGTDAVVSPATSTQAGAYPAADKAKMDSITIYNAETMQDAIASFLVAGSNITLTYSDVANTLTIASTGGGGTGTTNLSYTASPTNGVVISDTGTDATIPLADATNAGLMSPAHQIAVVALGTASTRNVGTGSTNLPDTAQLDTRLGTTGNLGTMAQQAASAVAITGGTINGTTVGVTTRAAARFTTLDANDTVTFSGLAKRLNADFSNSNVVNRFSLQTSTANANTIIQAIPTGTGTTASFLAFNNSAPTNSSYIALTSGASAMKVESAAAGSGTSLPLELWTNNAAQVTLSTAGNAGFGVVPDTSARIQSSNGIKLGNVVSANAQVLDYFEKAGTFTPVAIGSTTAGVGTYTTQSGKYTRIGDLCFINLTIGWSAHTGTGNLSIGGLPFTSASSGAPAVFSAYCDGLTIGTGKLLQLLLGGSSTAMTLRIADQAGGASSLLVMDTAVTIITIAGFYFV